VLSQKRPKASFSNGAAGKSRAFCRRQRRRCPKNGRRPVFPTAQPAKVAPFAGGNAGVLRKTAEGQFFQ
jgi:hypothetical protein